MPLKTPKDLFVAMLSDLRHGAERSLTGVNYSSQSTTTIFPYQRQLLSFQTTTDLLHWC